MKAVEAKGIYFAYTQEEEILRNVSFSVERGEFLGIVGRVGSGKTTLLNCLNGVIPKLIGGKVRGEISVMGRNPFREGARKMSAIVSTVLQNPDDQIFCESVFDEVAFALRNRKMEKGEIEEKVERALAQVRLEGFERRDPTALSVGQKQKLSVACALAMDNEIILLDEAGSSLGGRETREIFEALAGENRRGKTIIFAEHDLGILEGYAKKVAVLLDGRLKVCTNDGECIRKLKREGL
ncbi:hypothetical protein AUJ17_01480 [Candidatus Micrarchaeota archaeon CG1_02_47_40]|nr:MAG: hypothetical protein AUJ17_01480 [Candidatus Micrarchaeota archaeon CG1_02_47_40]